MQGEKKADGGFKAAPCSLSVSYMASCLKETISNLYLLKTVSKARSRSAFLHSPVENYPALELKSEEDKAFHKKGGCKERWGARTISKDCTFTL